MSYKVPKETLPKTEMFSDKFSMRLEFGRSKAGKLPGRIYLCVADKDRSHVAGTFGATARKWHRAAKDS